MKHPSTLFAMRSALGAALIILTTSACSDAPSAPRAPLRPEGVTSVGNGFTLFGSPSAPPSGGIGLSTTRRDVVTSDGRHFLVESFRDANGLPREVRVTRGGEPVIVLSNEWLASGSGFTLARQKLVRRANGHVPESFDSRDQGGVARVVGEPIIVVEPVGRSSQHARTLSAITGDGSYSSGPCDAQARAVDSALEDWLLSVAGMAVGTASANPWAAGAAWAYQLKKYRDVIRAEAALDQCVADAGKPPEW